MAFTSRNSPLRYPGGKGVIGGFLESIIESNNLKGCDYFELYAGGAGAALYLLLNDVVKNIHLNDADIHIYAFWHSVLHHPEEIIKRIEETPVTMEEWHKNREIYASPESFDLISLGFSTFFLNRTNRSGILAKAGPIGGLEQTGNYLIDARYNKKNLIKRIEIIANKKNNITISNSDSLEYLNNNRESLEQNNTFLYLDPPYYNKGKNLYLNFYTHEDHQNLAYYLLNFRNANWLVSYDNTPQIVDLYGDLPKASFDLKYTLQDKKDGKELLVFSDSLILPETITLSKKEKALLYL
ncbi:DNA adenine methylase [Marinifilum sp. D714]|uniref:DNA adenine methylase n=1 Tax=Marinifilum sp. D714 TaxID=2937523 RepID=UPI0027C07F51|nr:DNA adenine methylase [Marinifilum sp. D714]MDQ2177081.1 DNA adenine methylase [Marinifilum sp. D714]